MNEADGMPNGRLLLEVIGLNRERLNAGLKNKVAVPAQLFKALVSLAASMLPFDREFYLARYPDIKVAHETGRIADPRTHFIEEGYLEGRFGSKPYVDEEYYMVTYPDVQTAVTSGAVASALDHYFDAGAFEGRFPNSDCVESTKRWLAVLGR
jgi:hypothetical protein